MKITRKQWGFIGIGAGGVTVLAVIITLMILVIRFMLGIGLNAINSTQKSDGATSAPTAEAQNNLPAYREAMEICDVAEHPREAEISNGGMMLAIGSPEGHGPGKSEILCVMNLLGVNSDIQQRVRDTVPRDGEQQAVTSQFAIVWKYNDAREFVLVMNDLENDGSGESPTT